MSDDKSSEPLNPPAVDPNEPFWKRFALGDFNVVNEIAFLHFELKTLQLLFDVVVQRAGGMVGGLMTAADVDAAKAQAIQWLQQRAPNMGIIYVQPKAAAPAANDQKPAEDPPVDDGKTVN